MFAHDQHWEEQNALTAFLIFCMLRVYTLPAHFSTTQKQYWWDANTETIHQQLLHLFSIMQERWIIEVKWRLVKSIRHLKRSNKKVGWRRVSYTKSIQIVSQHGIKGPDTMANLVWGNTYISGYECIILYALSYAARKRFILVCVYLLHSWQAYISMQ